MDSNNSGRTGDWFQTYYGIAFYPLDPRPEDICIEDIAHALSNICRFNGHCRLHYSVGQHCVLGSYYVAPEHALWFLLHDASEAYLMDIIRPIKRSAPFTEYRAMEKRLQQIIIEKYGLSWPEPPEVKEADNRMLYTEKRDLINHRGRVWYDESKPYADRINPWSPAFTEAAYLARFNELTNGRYSNRNSENCGVAC